MADTDRLDAGPSSSPSSTSTSTSSSPTQQRQGQEIGSDCEPMYGVHPDANHEPRYEVHQDARKYKIGEPFPDFEIGASVMYTHNWFMSTEAVAVCRLCEEESMRYKTAGKQPPKSKKI